VWDADEGRFLREVDVHRGPVYGVNFNPEDPTLVASFSRDRTAVIWDVDSGEPIAELKHDEAVTTAAFDRKGKRLVTGSPTGSVRIWEWRTGTILGVLRMHGDYVNAAEFSPDGSLIATASDDRIARIYACTTCVQLDEVRRDAEERLRALGVEPSRE
jgi:WD40 repeat protein